MAFSHLIDAKLTIFICSTSHENDERLKIEDGVIQDTSGDVIFKVEFMAIACLPKQDEVLDGKVIDVMATGITV